MSNTTNLTIYRKKAKTTENLALDTRGVDAGMPFIDTVDDSLDSFVISLRNYPKRKPFEPFDLITYTVEDEGGTDTTQMFVLFDHVSYYSGINGKSTYTHKISCVETTKYLEKIKIFNLNLTNKNDTLYGQFVKALANAEPTITPSTYPNWGRFNMSQHLIDFLQGKASRDFYLGNTDLRSALDEMLQAENARIYVEEIIPTRFAYSVVLGYQSYNIIQDVIPIWEKDKHGVIVSEEMQNDGQNYAGHIVARGQNTVLEEPMTFADSFKSGNATINDKTAVVLLPFPISDKGIKNFTIKNIPLSYREVSAGIGTLTHAYVDIDIGSYIIPKQVYELLSEGAQRTYIPFDIGGDKIDFGYSWSKWFGAKTNNIVPALANSLPNINIDGKEYAPDLTIVSGELERLKWWNYSFECTYYPLINTIVDMEKAGVYNRDELLLGIADNQTEKTLNAELHGKKLAGLINRTGNPTYTVGVKADKVSSLLPVMSRITLPDAEDDEDKNYVLYRREYAVYDNYIDCKYYFSKNYNQVQKTAGVNRERQLYDIPLENDETPIVIKKYLLFSYDEILKNIDLSFNYLFSEKALNTVFDATYDTNGIGRIQYMLMESIATDSKGNDYFYPQYTENSSGGMPYVDNENARFVLPVAGYTHDKVMTFCAMPLDNYSISYSRDGYKFSIWGDGGYRITYNQYVSKEQPIVGECHAFKIDYAYNFNGGEEIVNKFPIVENPSENFSLATKVPIYIEYNKDRTQKPVFALSLECKVEKKYENNLIIGQKFVQENALLIGQKLVSNADICLFLYDNYEFGGQETTAPTDYGTYLNYYLMHEAFKIEPYIRNGINVGSKLVCIAESLPENIKSWAIVLKYSSSVYGVDNRIILAGNGKPKDIYCAVTDLPI